jgi:hypothetical protein
LHKFAFGQVHISTYLFIERKKAAAGIVMLRLEGKDYLLMGDAGSSNKAITSLICFSVKMFLCAKRGMLEQAL